jgi:uncharacterized phage protein (TIGR02220 family)
LGKELTVTRCTKCNRDGLAKDFRYCPYCGVPLDALFDSVGHDALDGAARKVLQELNAAAGRSFKPDGRKVEYIRARLRELASELPLEDAVAIACEVVRAKTREWLGTPMERYLRPETLFNKTKFDAYVQEVAPQYTLTDVQAAYEEYVRKIQTGQDVFAEPDAWLEREWQKYQQCLARGDNPFLSDPDPTIQAAFAAAIRSKRQWTKSHITRRSDDAR